MMQNDLFAFGNNPPENERQEDKTESFDLDHGYTFYSGEEEMQEQTDYSEEVIAREPPKPVEEELPELFKGRVLVRKAFASFEEDYSSKYSDAILELGEDAVDEVLPPALEDSLGEWQESETQVSANDLFELIDHYEALNEEQQYRSMLEMHRSTDPKQESYDPYNDRFNGFYQKENITEISLSHKVRMEQDPEEF